jgi:hypothetical protein
MKGSVAIDLKKLPKEYTTRNLNALTFRIGNFIMNALYYISAI